MTKVDCQRLIDEYLRWLRQEYSATEMGNACCITTPFADRHNDLIEIFIEKNNGQLRLTDDGETIRDLNASGLDFTTDKRKSHLAAVLNGFGVKLEGEEIIVTGSVQDFPQKKHNLVQALLAVNDLFVMGQEHVLSLFKEDVARFLEEKRIPLFMDFKLSGKSGLDHKFDFALPRTNGQPQRVLQAINSLTRDNAMAFAFSVADVKLVRVEALGAFAMINDPVNPPNEEHLNVLRNYDVTPLLWSHRDEAAKSLSSQNRN